MIFNKCRSLSGLISYRNSAPFMLPFEHGRLAIRAKTHGELQMFRRTTLLFLLFLLLLLAACQPNSPSELNAAPNKGEINILQEKPFGTGQLLLTSWIDESGASCMAGTYLIQVNGTYQPHDMLLGGCSTDTLFQAAYTGNSQIELFSGTPRHTTVFGRSEIGHAVRIVWQDGQVNHVPLVNQSFLEARDGKWAVERIELLDEQNNLIFAEDWGDEVVQGTN